MEAVGENCVVIVSLRWEDFVVPGITKEHINRADESLEALRC